MRKLKHLSPTSISTFKKSQEDFFKIYIADSPPPKVPQDKPMSIGSAFDAYAKSFLHERLFGKGADPRFEFETLFNAQVEKQNRDWAVVEGRLVFETYKESGALADLLLDLTAALGKPRFELELKGVVEGKREGVTAEIGEVVFLGKPDVNFLNKEAANVVLDWKVNGYCSQRKTSPMKGYIRLREGKVNTGAHKNAHPIRHKGVLINAGEFLEHCNVDWARQITIYAWLCGTPVGGDFIAAIDQIVGQKGDIRIAEHRLRVSETFQREVYAEANEIWEICHSDHFFRDMSKEASQERCALLEKAAKSMWGDTIEDRWFAEAVR